MVGQTDERKISPFYKTSTSIGAAAQKLKKKTNGAMGTASHIMVEF